MKNINQFLEEYADILFPEHKERILAIKNYLEPFTNMEKKTSKYGTHYVICSWSNDDAKSGPDTCECIDVNRSIKEIQKYINLYKRLKKIM